MALLLACYVTNHILLRTRHEVVLLRHVMVLLHLARRLHRFGVVRKLEHADNLEAVAKSTPRPRASSLKAKERHVSMRTLLMNNQFISTVADFFSRAPTTDDHEAVAKSTPRPRAPSLKAKERQTRSL